MNHKNLNRIRKSFHINLAEEKNIKIMKKKENIEDMRY